MLRGEISLPRPAAPQGIDQAQALIEFGVGLKGHEWYGAVCGHVVVDAWIVRVQVVIDAM